MATLPSATEAAALVSILAPGLIIATIRARVKSGNAPNYKDGLIAYALISAFYFAVVSPFFHVSQGLTLWPWLWNLLQYFIVPIGIGVVAAHAYQGRWTYRAAERLGLKLAHHVPAAWDYTFESLPAGTFVLVKLKDGTEIPGKMGANSFASSSNEERDLLLEELWEISAGGTWTPVQPPRNILLCGGDIRFVEIY